VRRYARLTDAVFDSKVLLGELVTVVEHELAVEDVDDAANRQVAVLVVDDLLVAHLLSQRTNNHRSFTDETIARRNDMPHQRSE